MATPVRSLCCTLSSIAVSFVIHAGALAAGMTTHGEVSQRALWYFASERHPIYAHYAAQYQDALQAGAVFPDWGYQFGYSDESEAAHWDPFIQAAAAYLHATYPQPWDEETQKLAVFLLGVMSHSTADIYWHSLGVSRGFLETMAAVDFHGGFDDAHTHGDFGGDVVLAHEADLSWMADTWYVPVYDMAAVYNELGYHRVSADILARYTFILFLAAHLERSKAGLLFPLYAAPSPFLVEQLEHYFLGGLDDMAIRSAWRWEDVIEWMESGGPGQYRWVGSKVAAVSGADVERELDRAVSSSRSILLALGDVGASVERTQRGVVFRIGQASAAGNASIRRNAEPLSAPSGRHSQETFPEGRSLICETSVPYSYLGQGLATGDFDLDGLADVAIGAPGYGTPGHPQRGAVYIVYGREEIGSEEHIDLPENADAVLAGSEDAARFGWSMATVDLDADGVDDLAISAPTLGARDLSFTGSVFVYSGSRLNKKGLQTEPDSVIAATEHSTLLGWSLAAGECDGDGHKDLIVGAPFAGAGGRQRGLVAVFLSSRFHTHRGRASLEDADWLVVGSADYDWFGYSAACVDAGEGRRLLLVSSPTAKKGDTQSVGRLYGFDVSSAGSGTGEPVEVFSIAGTDEFDKAGSSFTCGDPFGTGELMLVLSAPTRTVGDRYQTGSVLLVPLESLHGEMSADTVPVRAAISGEVPFGRLGWQAKVTDLNNDGIDDLWASEPWRDTNAGVEAGAAHLWLGGPSFPARSVSVSAEPPFWGGGGGVAGSLFGAELLPADMNGDGSADAILSAPRLSSRARYAGAVYVLITPAPILARVWPAEAQRGSRGTYTISGKRLYPEGLSVALQNGDYTIFPADIRLIDEQTIQCEISIPDDAPLGLYGLHLKTLFGVGTIEGAVEVRDSPPVEQGQGRMEEGRCGCSHFGTSSGPAAREMAGALFVYLLPGLYATALRRRTPQRP